MSLLLDTSAVLLTVAGAWLQPAAAAAIDEAHDRGDRLYVSPVLGWEIGLAAAQGRFKSRYTLQRWLETFLSRPEIGLADLPPQVLLASWSLPGSLNRDPAGRIVAATAREFGYTVMTRDKALLDYGREGHLSVLEC